MRLPALRPAATPSALPLLPLLALLSCLPPPPQPGAAGPAEAVRAFAAALARSDAAAAWDLLSSRTQREADRLAAEARAKSGGATPASGRQMLFGSALPAGKITAHELSQDGGAAEVSVVDASGRAQSFRAVREGGVWKVDLDLPAG